MVETCLYAGLQAKFCDVLCSFIINLNKTSTEHPQSHCIDSWAGIHPGHEDGISPLGPIIKEQTDLECSIVATVPQVDGA